MANPLGLMRFVALLQKANLLRGPKGRGDQVAGRLFVCFRSYKGSIRLDGRLSIPAIIAFYGILNRLHRGLLQLTRVYANLCELRVQCFLSRGSSSVVVG